MQKHRNIKALFFLGIFSILLLHQIVPHWHHQDQGEHQHSEVAHSHQHDHHHERPENKTSKKGVIEWFLEVHVHSVAAIDFLVLKRQSIKKFSVKKELSKSLITAETNFVNSDNTHINKLWFDPPDRIHKPYFSSYTLRGPPRLG